MQMPVIAAIAVLGVVVPCLLILLEAGGPTFKALWRCTSFWQPYHA